ncbi:hypothetical protein IscW_ISCW011868, partial [Ixodes scapularis]
SRSHETETILQARTPNYPAYCLPSAEGFLFNGPTTTNDAHYKVSQTALPPIRISTIPRCPATLSQPPPLPFYIFFSFFLSLSLLLLTRCATARYSPPSRARTSRNPS